MLADQFASVTPDSTTPGSPLPDIESRKYKRQASSRLRRCHLVRSINWCLNNIEWPGEMQTSGETKNSRFQIGFQYQLLFIRAKTLH